MRNQIFHSPGNEEGELAKIPGDGDPPPPHWDLYIWKGSIDFIKKNYKFRCTKSSFLNLVRDQTLFESQAKNKDFENSRQSNLIQLSIWNSFNLIK